MPVLSVSVGILSVCLGDVRGVKWFGKYCSRQTQVSRSMLIEIKEKNLSSLKDFAFNPKYA